jgi:ABC-2 type transport system permease protein
MMNTLNTIRQLRQIFFIQLKNNFVREIVYRTNFITMLMVDFIWMMIELGLFKVIYAHTQALGGWTLHQVFFFLGIFFCIEALFGIFFSTNFWRFPSLVNQGELDIILTKPTNSLFLIFIRGMNLTSIFNLAFGIVIATRYADDAGFPGGWYWAYAILWMGVGVLTQFLLRFLFSLPVFWTERGFAFARLYYQFHQIATKPDSIYPWFLRYAIMTVLPFAIIGSIPARALLMGLTRAEWIMVGSSLFLLYLLWKKGLQRYQSASS